MPCQRIASRSGLADRFHPRILQIRAACSGARQCADQEPPSAYSENPCSSSTLEKRRRIGRMDGSDYGPIRSFRKSVFLPWVRR